MSDRTRRLLWAREVLERQFMRMQRGECIQIGDCIRRAAFPEDERPLALQILSAGAGHRPETPPLVQEEMLLGAHSMEIRSVHPLSGVVTYQKTGRNPKDFSALEIDQIRRGETPERLRVHQ